MRNNPVFIILNILVCLNTLAWIAVYDLSQQDLQVIFFDVGQGDATLIRTPHGHHILIDGGPSSVVLEKLGQEMPFWSRELDLIILTHPHYDHMAGMIEVIKNYRVKNVLWTGVLTDTIAFGRWQELLEEGEFDIHIARAGQRIYGGPVVLQIFHPFENLENQTVSNLDDTSIVVKTVFEEKSFLFTGDAFQAVEMALLEKGLDVSSSVLQVGHHGSRTSTAQDFVRAVSPQIAIISAGRDNRHGHPHKETLDTLGLYEAVILRTDEQGDIKIFSDGTNYLIR